MPAEKFSSLSKTFQKMYNKGKTYDEITKELDISTPTATSWRKKLNLPLRRTKATRSWMDIPTSKDMTPRQILQPIRKQLRITQNDVEYILMRVDKLKSKGLLKGRRYEHAVLASAFLYLRWEGSGRRPVSETRFLEICNKQMPLGILDRPMSRRVLHKTCELFAQANLFPKKRLKPKELINRTWLSLQQRFDLPESIKIVALAFAESPELQGCSAGGIAAASIYIACIENRCWIAQRDLEAFFGVTEVTIRNIVKRLRPDLAEKRRQVWGGTA